MWVKHQARLSPSQSARKGALKRYLRRETIFVSLNEPDYFLSLGVNLNARSFTRGHQESNKIISLWMSVPSRNDAREKLGLFALGRI
jgi:hypothetical protein